MQSFYRSLCSSIVVVLSLLTSNLMAQPQLSQRAEFVPNRVIVKLKPQKSLNKASQTQSTLQAAVRANTVQRLGLINAEVWELSGRKVEDVVAELQKDSRVEYAEPDYIVHATTTTPNDPLFGQLWGMTKIQAPQAWDLTTGGSVLIGVIDSGVDYNHPDLAANMWTNPGESGGGKETNGIDDDNNGYIDDVHGYDFVNNDGDPMDDQFHGTHVAGTIAAVGNNGVGVVGVNWSARIMALKFLGASGSGTTSNAILAVQYATQMGAQLTNNSWGGGSYSQALYDAISAAGVANRMFVAAAGNDGLNADTYPYFAYPATYDLDNIISVAATDVNDAKASFSNYGATTVDLGAPGVGILSTYPTAHANGPYFSIDGTSMASPHVAGVAALIWALHPSFSVDDVKAIILSSVDPVASMSGITVTGGRLNAYNAVTLSQTWTPYLNPAIALNSNTFSATLDPEASSNQILSISNQTGARNLNWSRTTPTESWLTLNKTSGKVAGGATEQVQLTITAPYDLAAGNYQATFDINSNDPNNPTVQVTVNLTVNFLPPPEAAVSPASMSFNLITGQSANNILTIYNNAAAGSRNLHWSATKDASWLALNAGSGIIAPQNNQTVQVTANAIGLTSGIYNGTIAVTGNDPNSPSFQIPVELTVTEEVVGGQKLYWIQSSDLIKRAELNGTGAVTVQSGLASAIAIDLAVDEINRKVYWATLSGETIHRSNLNGTNAETVLSGLNEPYSLAVDPANGHIYWIEVFPVANRSIRRANYDGTGVVTLINLKGQNNNGLSLDIAGGKMYWTEGFNIPSPEGIWRANLDGSSPEKIITAEADPFGLALDLVHGKLYWGEIYPNDAIHRANLDGSDDEVLFAGPQLSPNGLAVDPFAGKLYWNSGGALYWGNTDGTGAQALGLSGGSPTLDLSAEPAATVDNYNTNANATLTRNTSDNDDLLDNDNRGWPLATITSFGGGSLGGSVTDNAAGASVTLAGGTLTVNGDGSFSLTTPTVAGAFTFQYRLSNALGTSDATVTIEVRQAPTAVADNYTTNINTTLSRATSATDDLLDNDTRGFPLATIISFGGGSLGGAVTDNAAGDEVAFAGGTLKVNSDGSFTLTTPTVIDNHTFQYRLSNSLGTSDATVTIEVVAPPVSPFVFLANKVTLASTKQVPSYGDMHSNGTLAVTKGYPSTYNSNLTAVGQITIGKYNTINGNVKSQTSVSNSGTINGTKSIGPVANEPLPSLSYSAGGPNKTVPSGGALTLAPGSYGIVTMRQGGTLKLTSGEYFMNELRYSSTISNGTIEIDLSSGAPVKINVVTNLQLGAEAAIVLLPNGEADSKLVTFNTLQATNANWGREGYFLGSFNAPNAIVTLVKNSQLRGAISAKEILVSNDCLFLHHDSPGSLPGPGDLPKSSFDEEEAAGDQSTVTSYQLEQNYPNPFNPSTTISFALPQAGEVSLSIFNTNGQLVKKLVTGEMNAGLHSFTWDATNERGERVASGVYLYVLKAGGFTAQKKLVLMK